MANYELMMILNPSIGEASLTASIDAVRTSLSAAGATIQKEDVWGEKKLAYKIKSSENGYYVLWTLELDGKHIKTLNTQMNLDGNLWRYMFVNLDA